MQAAASVKQDSDPIGLAGLVTQAVDDGRDLVAAEIALYKAKAAERLQAYKGAAIFFALAGVLALAALVAMLVGLILSVATVVGPGLATLIVIGVTVAIAAGLAWTGKQRLAPPVPGRGS